MMKMGENAMRKMARRMIPALAMVILIGAVAGCENKGSITKKRIKSVEKGLTRAVFLKGLKTEKLSINARMQFYRVPGLSVAVMDGYHTEWARAYGTQEYGAGEPVTTGTLFQAGPLSRAIAAASALKLVADGRLDLDGNIEATLKGWNIPREGVPEGRVVTLRGLLTDAAGFPEASLPEIPGPEPASSLSDLLNGKLKALPTFPAPSLADTRNVGMSEPGYAVLEKLIEDAAGKSYDGFVQDEVFGPLGMSRSTFDSSIAAGGAGPQGAARGHDRSGRTADGGWFRHSSQAVSGLWSDPSELMLFIQDLLASAMGKGGRLLPAELARAMLSVQAGRHGFGFMIDGAGTDVRINLRGRTKGFTCVLEVYPYRGQGAVVMADSDNGLILADEVLRAVSAAYEWPDFKSQEKTPYRLDPSIYSQFVGHYEVGPGYALDVTFEDYYLVIKPTGQVATRFYAESGSFFFSIDPYIRIQFLFDRKSDVTGLVLWQEDFKLEGRKTG